MDEMIRNLFIKRVGEVLILCGIGDYGDNESWKQHIQSMTALVHETRRKYGVASPIFADGSRGSYRLSLKVAERGQAEYKGMDRPSKRRSIAKVKPQRNSKRMATWSNSGRTTHTGHKGSTASFGSNAPAEQRNQMSSAEEWTAGHAAAVAHGGIDQITASALSAVDSQRVPSLNLSPQTNEVRQPTDHAVDSNTVRRGDVVMISALACDPGHSPSPTPCTTNAPDQSGLIAKIMETMHLDCASLNYVVGIYGLDKKEMLMATKFNSIRRYAKEIIGYEYDKAVDVIKKENAIVASKDIQGRYNETIYWDIIMKGAKSLDPATLRTAKGPLDSFTMAEKTAAEKFMDLAGFGTSPANQRRYRRLWKSLASMRQAGVDRILFYRTKEFNAFCIKNFENEQVSLVEEVLSWERLYGPHIEQLEVRARRSSWNNATNEWLSAAEEAGFWSEYPSSGATINQLGGLLDIKTAEGGRENRAIFVSLVPLEASLLSVCPIIGVQQGDFLGVFAGKIRYTDTFDALYQIPGPRENLWLDYSQTTGVLNLMRVSPPDGDANVRLDWEFAEGKDGSASALSWRVSVRALRTIMPFEQLIRSAPNIDQYRRHQQNAHARKGFMKPDVAEEE